MMGFSDIWSICQNWGPVFGPVICVLTFFLWKDWRREDMLQKRVEQLEKDQKDLILPMMQRCTEVITRNTEVISQAYEMLTRISSEEDRDERKIVDRLMDDAAKQRKVK